MAYRDILYEVRDRIAHLTLNRPEKRNAISPQTIGELLHALDAAKRDPGVRVIVLGAAGKLFCAGADLAAFATDAAPLAAPGAGESTLPGSFVDLNLAFTRLGKPTIAKVQGHALAGGLGLVVACDLALASDDAEFATPEINVGIWPMMIMATIFRNVPRKRGLEMMLTGERISAAEAARMGLITRAVPRDRVAAEVEELASKLAAKAPLAMKLGLDAFHATQDLELEPALRRLEAELVKVLGSEDAREGLAAFLEKRPPLWKGR